MSISDKELVHTLELVNATSQNKAARELGIARSTLQSRLKRATERGLSGYNVDGKLPVGLALRGVSSLYGKDGELKGQWVKTGKDQSLAELKEAIEDAFQEYKGNAVVIKPPKTTPNEDLATFYIVSDHHLGLYSWSPETGSDYDTEIASNILKETMGTLVQNTPYSKHAVVLNLGDFFHSDNNENRTLRSGNALDVDTRYARVLQIGVELMIWTIEQALAKHEQVTVRCLQGNHDPYAALALSVALAQFFKSNSRVVVDTDPSPFFWWTFGKVFIASTHGDMIKHTAMPGVMAAYKPKEWGNAEHRYIYLGHVHHQSIGGGETAGVVWETFRCLTAKDAWHRQSGYSSGRSMVAITHHKDKGEVMRHTVTYEGPR